MKVKPYGTTLTGMYIMDFVLSIKSGKIMGNERVLVRKKIKGPVSGGVWGECIYHEL
jgi:hypothetical protein